MQELFAAIRKRSFSPAYLLVGEDEFRKEDALRHLIDAAVDPTTRDFNLDVRRAAELEAESLASLLAMPPMMADRRTVVVRDVTALRKGTRAALESYLRSPSPDVLVVLTSPAGAKEDKTLGRLTETVNCAPLTGAQLPKWIVSRAEKLGVSITPAAVELLQDAVGPDLSQLAIELDKLASYAEGIARPGRATGASNPGDRVVIDDRAVADVVGIRREETLGSLLDAVANRKAAEALALIPGVLRNPKNSGVTSVLALTTQTLALAIGKARGFRHSGDFFGLLRSGSSNFTGRAWGEAGSAWSQAMAKWTLADLDHALVVLLQTDLALKGSKVSSEEQILASAVLAVCAGATLSHAA